MFGNFNYQPCCQLVLPVFATRGNDRTKRNQTYRNDKILQKLAHVNNKPYNEDHFSPVFDNPGLEWVFGATWGEKVHFPPPAPKSSHPITQSHPELSAALRELQFYTEICSFSTLYCVIDVRTIVWRDDGCAPKEEATHSKHFQWDEIPLWCIFLPSRELEHSDFPPGILSCNGNFVLFATFLSEPDVFHKMPG